MASDLYRFKMATNWVANFDKPLIRDTDKIEQQPTVRMLGEIFNVSTYAVAKIVLTEREKLFGKAK